MYIRPLISMGEAFKRGSFPMVSSHEAIIGFVY